MVLAVGGLSSFKWATGSMIVLKFVPSSFERETRVCGGAGREMRPVICWMVFLVVFSSYFERSTEVVVFSVVVPSSFE